MERNQILMKEKLAFSGLLQEVSKIFYQNPRFLILSFLTSLPIFSGMLVHELWLQKTLIEAVRFMSYGPPEDNNVFRHDRYMIMHTIIDPINMCMLFIEKFGLAFLQLGLMYFPLIHLPDLVHTIGVVSSTSVIYSGEKILNIKEMFLKSFKNDSFKRTLITSFYVILLASLVSLGLLAIVSQVWSFSSGRYAFSGDWLTLPSSLYIIFFVVLLFKYIQWSNVWNLGIITSILEEKRGDIALGVSAYISRGNRRHGEIVTVIFFVWKLSLRLMATIYAKYHQSDIRRVILITAFQVLLVCIGNVIKWVIFMVFFYDCKLRFLEKKVDIEEGKKADVKEGNEDSFVDTATSK